MCFIVILPECCCNIEKENIYIWRGGGERMFLLIATAELDFLEELKFSQSVLKFCLFLDAAPCRLVKGYRRFAGA
jgi:hypothetical protein